jgi:hypothetical protein
MRLDNGARANAGGEAELPYGVAGDRRGQQEWPGLELDECHHAIGLDRADDSGEAVAG